MKNNKITKDTVPEGFSVVMALVDLIPVVFFGLSAVRVGRLFQSALFVTGALFERTLPGGQERIAFCTLQQPVYTRTSVAAYRPENPRAALCREAIALTRELVLPRLELPV